MKLFFLCFLATPLLLAQSNKANWTYTPRASLETQVSSFSASSIALPDSTKPKRNIVDPWLGFDKVQHMTFSFLFTLGHQYVLVNRIGQSEDKSFPVSVVSTAFIGLAKELYDLKLGRNHFFSKRDLASDAIGIALASLVIKAGKH
jgi:uncharacterized protein YfiM (DUF2279 family)